MIQEAPIKMYVRGVVSYFYFSRAPGARAEIRQINSAILKVGTMELPVPNSSMQHPDPNLDFDDTRMILHGASYT
jgi:hypothetical protein